MEWKEHRIALEELRERNQDIFPQGPRQDIEEIVRELTIAEVLDRKPNLRIITAHMLSLLVVQSIKAPEVVDLLNTVRPLIRIRNR